MFLTKKTTLSKQLFGEKHNKKMMLKFIDTKKQSSQVFYVNFLIGGHIKNKTIEN